MHELELYKEMYYPSGEVPYRSEGVGNYLITKYGLKPNNTWFNIYSKELKLRIGEYSVSLPLGAEIPFYNQNKLIVGVGIIEEKPGFMKFTPIYTENQYGLGLKPGDSLFGYVYGFPFAVAPKIYYSGGYNQFEINELVYGS